MTFVVPTALWKVKQASAVHRQAAAGTMASGRLQGFCAVGPTCAARTNALRAYMTAPSAALRYSQGEEEAGLRGGNPAA